MFIQCASTVTREAVPARHVKNYGIGAYQLMYEEETKVNNSDSDLQIESESEQEGNMPKAGPSRPTMSSGRVFRSTSGRLTLTAASLSGNREESNVVHSGRKVSTSFIRIC